MTRRRPIRFGRGEFTHHDGGNIFARAAYLQTVQHFFPACLVSLRERAKEIICSRQAAREWCVEWGLISAEDDWCLPLIVNTASLLDSKAEDDPDTWAPVTGGAYWVPGAGVEAPAWQPDTETELEYRGRVELYI